MKTELDSLATALYVKTDDLLKDSPQLAPSRPAAGTVPRLSDAELVTLAMMQAVLGCFTSEARWLRHARAHLRHLFPYLPQQPGYNKRLRKAAGLIRCVTRALARDTALWSDDVWVADSTPVECGRSRETVKRSDLAGWAQYGYCASHTRYFWGLRLHLVCTLHGLPVAFALTGAKADERETLLDLFAVEPQLTAERQGQTLIGDKNYFGRDFEQQLAEPGIRLLRPARKGEAVRPGSQLFKPLRQVIESINETFKGQLDLERHHGRTPGGVMVRVLQRILALTAAIWHNDHTGQPVMRALTAYDHLSLGIDHLGGHDNFAVDRAAALAVSEAAPEMKLMALENRKFLRRAVRYLAAEAGIVQFLDIGTGLPTQGNVHQVAQQVTADARVVYADNDRCNSGCAQSMFPASNSDRR